MRFLKKLWAGWMAFAAIVGGFISSVIMVAFYFTAFLIFAVPFRLFGKDLLKRRAENSNWRDKARTPSTLKDLQEES